MLAPRPSFKSPTNRGRRVVDAAPALFNRTLLKGEMTVELATRELERHLVNPATRMEETIAELIELDAAPHAFEFVLSVVNEESYGLLRTAIVESFPQTPEQFSSSIASKLLTRLPLFLLFLPQDGPSIRMKRDSLRASRQSAESACAALQAMSGLQFGGESDEQVGDELGEYGDLHFAVKRKGQNKKKQRKRGKSTSTVDFKAIAKAGYAIPETKKEAITISTSILEEQLRLLKDYLEMFRLPAVATVIKHMYLSPPGEVDNSAAEVDITEPESYLTPEDEQESQIVLPPVLPMKAALYFDSADGFGEWRILISTRADRDLRQARRRDAKTFAIFVKKIKELSKGHFSDDNQKRLTGLDVEIPIYEAKMTSDTRLVYQVDCVPEFESTIERQVLRIFGIYTHAQLDRRFWDCMSRQLGRRGLEYQKRCTFRNAPMHKGDKVFMPASWPPPAEPAALEPVPGASAMRKEDLEELHSLLVLEKFVTFSQALLNSILADQEVAHVFDVTPQEKKIIEHPSSCYVLGRSGTGKTTTMLFKMLGIERAWESHRDAMAKPRQLFVTQSRVLAEKVEEYFTKLLDSLATASQSPAELVKIASRKKQQQEQGLVDRDEEIFWRGDLPQRYGALKDEHFPMFLTYDHICRLLESEFQHNVVEVQRKEASARAIQDALDLQDSASRDGLSNDYMQQRRARFVSYGTFLEEYWSHFPQTLTKGLDPTLVFGEFMGVIKGSELALDTPAGHLDRDTYFNLSHRTQGTFANQRDCIYKLFKAYLKRKKERGDYDAADRTHSLIASLRANGVPGQDIDFVYVDEAQDNLLIDALVLRTLCRNPHGMFWAGDTAQTISVGSAFRFNDLKSFLYRIEEANARENIDRRPQPESFHLAVNYRSHAGIVNCAHSVIQLITAFWPHAIDTLAEERGMIDGLKPVFFSGWDQNTVRYEQFLFGESGSHLEFGAEQCILVRDDAARDRLRAEVGDIGLIMTLYESKGLEFNDVLLYNFFEDSTVDLSQWRVVLNALPEKQRENHPAPRFDDARHSGVCRELKFLYVAITRARKNLWIADGSEKGEPMRIVWTHRDQIQNCTPGTDVPRLAMSSTAEDWAKTALSLFNHRRYMQAMHCYERAGLVREKAVAHAYYLRELARSTPVPRGDTTAQSLAFSKAAQAFIDSAQNAITEKRTYYRIAAECHLQCGDDYKAAQAYLSATEYTLAAQHFRKAGKFGEAVRVVQTHKDKVSASVAEGIVDVSRLYYLRDRQIQKARELFDTDEEALEYMDDFGLDVARASFLENIGRYADAAELQFAEGNTLDAIRLLTLDRSNELSMRRAFQYLLDGLWRVISCGVDVSEAFLKVNDSVATLLRLGDALEGVPVDGDLLNEVSMFRAIVKRDMSALLSLSESFSSSSNMPATFLCLDFLFSFPLKLQTASLSGIATQLTTFLKYVRKLRELGSVSSPCEDHVIRKIFALQVSTEDVYLLPQSSFLGSLCGTSRYTPNARSSEEGTFVPRGELERLIKHVFNVRLLKAVREENKICYSLRPLQPCLPYVVFRQCNRVDCPRNHEDYQRYNADAYNARVRVQIIQILIYQTICTVENAEESVRQQRHWLRQLYEALIPPYYKLGSMHVLSPQAIPEMDTGLQIVRVWVRDLLYRLDPRHPEHLFLTIFVRTVRLALIFDSQAAFDFLPRVPCIRTHRPPFLMRGNTDKMYVVHDLLALMQNSDIYAVDRGILFLNHVLGKRLPIDSDLLCDFMNHLCGSIVVATRLQSQDGTLHNITLPRSWIARLLPAVSSLRLRECQLAKHYTANVGALLEQVYTGADHLLFESRDLSKLGFSIRNVIFARICQNICLFGYNVRIPTWRDSVTRAIMSVRKQGQTFHHSINQYVRATCWDDLAKTVRHSTSDSALDEMIELHHGSKPLSKPPPRNVRRIIYNREEDIPFLLKTDATSMQGASLRPDATPFIPASLAQAASEENIVDETHLEDIEGDGDEPADRVEAVDIEDITQAIDAHQAKVEVTAPTPLELAAADTIATAYQRYRIRTRAEKNTTAEIQSRILNAFRQQSVHMVWPHRHYRMLFLGPVPRLYIAVEGMKNYLHEARSKAKKRFNVVAHLELESAKSSLTEMNRLFKAAVQLHRELAPTADVHQQRDIEKLKAYTVEAQELLRGLPTPQTLAWNEDLRIAYLAIVEVRQLPTKPPKPELNTDDPEE